MHSMYVFFMNRVISKPKIIVAMHFCSTKLRIQLRRLLLQHIVMTYCDMWLNQYCVLCSVHHSVMFCILRAFSFDIQTVFTSFSFLELLHWADTFDLH